MRATRTSENRTVERNVGDGNGRGSRETGEGVRAGRSCRRDEGDHHLGVGMVVIREHRTQSAVDQSGDEDLIFRCGFRA